MLALLSSSEFLDLIQRWPGVKPLKMLGNRKSPLSLPTDDLMGEVKVGSNGIFSDVLAAFFDTATPKRRLMRITVIYPAV